MNIDINYDLNKNINSHLSELDNLFVLKHFPSDFVVTEVLSLNSPLQKIRDESDFYNYCKLSKRGYTTFEAIHLIAQHLDTSPQNITYSGLKDEDGTTEQSIAIQNTIDPLKIESFNAKRWNSDKFIKLFPYGFYANPLKIGKLEGNAFRIKARNVPKETADTLGRNNGKTLVSFINYYDTQRFGVPDAPKTTHLIGLHLENDEYDKAINLLKSAGTPESQDAKSYTGLPKQFFESLDSRITAFFRSAYSSYCWNSHIQNTLLEIISEQDLIKYNKHGIDYITPKISLDLHKLTINTPTHKYRRYGKNDSSSEYDDVDRPTVLQSNVQVYNIEEDKEFPNTSVIDMSFFLPAGVYATNILTQFFLRLGYQNGD